MADKGSNPFQRLLSDLKTGTSSGGTGIAGMLGKALQGGGLFKGAKMCPTGYDAQGNRVCPYTCKPLTTPSEQQTGVSDQVAQGGQGMATPTNPAGGGQSGFTSLASLGGGQ